MTVPSRHLILEADLRYCPRGIGTDAAPATGTLTINELTWWHRGRLNSLQVDDLLGVAPLKDGLRVSTCPLNARRTGRRLETYDFQCSVRSQWLQAFNTVLASSPRHLIVIVNPISGRRRGQRIWQQVRPIFAAARIQVTLMQPMDQEHLQQLIQDLDLADGLVVVGGDGTIHTVVNALMQRSDADLAIQTPIGIIPAGTGNGLCQSLLAQSQEPYGVVSAGFAIAKGQPQPLDIVQIQQSDAVSYSVLSLAWGLISDIDLGSERLRWLGPLRNSLYALLLIARLRTYAGQIVLEKKTEQQAIAGPFIAVWGMNVPWATRQDWVAPEAELDGGTVELLMVRQGASRWRLLQAFLQLGTGGHLQFPEVECFKVRQFTVLPETGQLAIDGELVPCQATTVTVLQRWGRVFAKVADLH